MAGFLNNFMEEFNNLTSPQQEQKLIEWRKIFKNTILEVKEILGNKPFQRSDKTDGRNYKGWKFLLNESLFDCIMYGFSHISHQDLMKIKDDIPKELDNLMKNNKDFQDSISGGKSGSTSMVSHLKNRIKLFQERLTLLLQNNHNTLLQPVKENSYSMVQPPLIKQSMGLIFSFPASITSQKIPIKITPANSFISNLTNSIRIIALAHDSNTNEVLGTSDIVEITSLSKNPFSMYVTIKKLCNSIKIQVKDVISNNLLEEHSCPVELKGYDTIL